MYRTVELFSGIGSQMKAMRNLDMEIEKSWTCEWDVHAVIAYAAIHNSTEISLSVLRMKKDQILEKLASRELSIEGKSAANDVALKNLSPLVLRRLYSAVTQTNNFINISQLTGEDFPEQVDIMTYSFPCQDISNVGAFHGYNKGIEKGSGSRSSLLWEVGRILEEMKTTGKTLPRYLLMENVPALLSERHLKNFNVWISDLEELGYISRYYQLNALDFGLPQNRPRLLMLSVYTGDNQEKKEKIKTWFDQKDERAVIEDYCNSVWYTSRRIQDLLRTDYTDEVLFEEACEACPNDTESRRKIWEENPQLVLEGNVPNPDIQFVRTITTKQDRNPNSGNLWFDSHIENRSSFRYLTPRECMLFMGFTDEDYERLQKRNPEIRSGSRLFSRDKIIRMAGNSIPVQLLEGIMLQIKKLDRECI